MSKGGILSIIAIAIAMYYGSHCWFTIIPRSAADFAEFQFQIMKIPTVEYDNLFNITEIMSEFVVYRSKKSFNVDLIPIIGGETLRTKRIDKTCKRKSTICNPCFVGSWEKRQVYTSSIQSILLRNTSESEYGSFSKLPRAASKKVLDLLGSNIDFRSSLIDHSFVSNLKHPMVTAAFHANGMSSSVAFQVEGKKTWIFFDKEDYIDGWGALIASGVLLPRNSPNRKVKLFLYTSEPGDLLFFPPFYAHAVVTHPGRNFMLNYRKADYLLTAIRNPAQIATAFTNILIDKAWDFWNFDFDQPEKRMNLYSGEKIEAACKDKFSVDSGLKADAQLLQLLRKTVLGLENL